MRKKLISGLMLAILMATTGMLCIGGFSEKRYAQRYAHGGTLIRTINETIYYARRDVDQYYLNPGLPLYYGNSCGIIAGGVSIAHFNVDYTNLIPGHTAGKYVLGKWSWTGQNNYIDDLFAQLYIDMDANSYGVTIAGYLDGLDTYVDRQGYEFTSTNTMNGSALDLGACISAFQSGELVSIFMDGFNVTDGPLASFAGGEDLFILEEYAGAHVMAAYGYAIVEYFDEFETMFRQDTFLAVNNGFGDLGYVRINANITIDDCYAINVA